MKTQTIELSKLRTDGGTQAREEISNDTVREYAAAWEAGDDFPPIDVFYDGATYWIADGFHRFYGKRDAKKKSIECIVHQGTVRDAILFAVGANRTNGLRRNNKDKRRAVLILLEDEEWGQWTDREISEKAGVSHPFVGDIRRDEAEKKKELETVSNSPPAEAKPAAKRKAKGGKTYPSTRKPAAKKDECPRGGKHEPDADGDCSKCLEPGVGEKAPEAKPEPPKPAPKNGAAKPDLISIDGKIDDFFGKLIRSVDDRASAGACLQGPHHRRAIALLNAFKEIVTKWQKGIAL